MIEKLLIDRFNSKLEVLVPYVNTEKVRILATTDNITKLNDLYGDPDTPKTWLGDWPLYANKGKRSLENIQSIESLRPKLEKVISKICNDIPERIWTDADRNMFERKTGARKPPTKPSKIEEFIVPSMISMGGGLMKCGCKKTTSQKRASLPKGATGVQIAYNVVDHPAKNDAQDETKMKRQVVDSPDGCTNKDYFTGATFELELDPSDVGRELQYFLQWYNSKHKKNAGPWCGPFTANI